MSGTCPPDDQLALLLSGRMDSGTEATLQQHLDNCADCQQRLEQLAAPASFREDVARQLPASAAADGGQHTVADRYGPVDPTDLWFLDPPTAPGEIGRLGPYGILEVIGAGGMGVVLRGHDPSLDRPVAVKALHRHALRDPMARERFLREARSGAGLSHHNIVTVYQVEEFNDVPVLVMEFVEGQSLQAVLAKGTPLSVSRILSIARQVAAGLAAAHQRGLIHRDIKPGNILLEQGSGRVRITDFGLARAIDDPSLTSSGMIVGTPAYMAPEQAEGSSVDHRTDLFSLGGVIHAACTGDPPFKGDSSREVLNKVLLCRPPRLQTLRSDLPSGLVDVVAHLLQREPDERFQEAREVAAELRQVTARVRSEADTVVNPTLAADRPRGSQKKTGKPTSRFDRRAAVGLATALLLLATIVVLSRPSAQPTAETTDRRSSTGDPAKPLKPGTGSEVAVEGFTVLGKDGTRQGRLATFSEALAVATAGATIEIARDGDVEVDPVVVDRPLTIRAAVGHRPELACTVGVEGRPWLTARADVVLERLTVKWHRRVDRRERRAGSAIRVDGGRVVLSHCRIECTEGRAAVEIVRAPEVRIVDCELYHMVGAVMSWSPRVGGRLEISNCVALGSVGVDLVRSAESRNPQRLLISESTWVVDDLLAMHMVGARNRPQRPIGGGDLFVELKQTLVAADGALLAVRMPPDRLDRGKPPPPPMMLTRQLKWIDIDTVLSPGGPLLDIRIEPNGPEVPAPWAPRTPNDWTRFWKEAPESVLRHEIRFVSRELRTRREPLERLEPPAFATDPPVRSGARIDAVGPSGD
ncbi:MAG: hypothetical protein CMJ65_16720 [Planctomycetaceae bacterium]|jgi:serine/threonine protein kinase|nr:hypothetical protein [Planctomycetaceae bacterium]